MRRILAFGLIFMVLMSVAGFAYGFRFSSTPQFTTQGRSGEYGKYTRTNYGTLLHRKAERTARLTADSGYDRFPELKGFETRFGPRRNTYAGSHVFGSDRYNTRASGLSLGTRSRQTWFVSSRYSYGNRLR